MMLLFALALSSFLAVVQGQPTSCGFCPGGNPPTNPGASIDFSLRPNSQLNSTLTCGEVHNDLLGLYAPGEQCERAQFEAVLGAIPKLAPGISYMTVAKKNDSSSSGSTESESESESELPKIETGYPSQCGYCETPPETDLTATCSICPDGSTPNFPADTSVTLPDGTETTCGAVSFLAQYEPTDSLVCSSFQSVSRYCGCQPTTCAVCPDGTELPDPNKWSFTAERTCKDVARNAESLDPTDDRCREIQTIVLAECGCDYVPPIEPTCSLCADGRVVPNPSFQLFPGEEISTCGMQSWYASLPPFSTGQESCEAVQATYGAACGCPSTPEPPCPVSCRAAGESFNGAHVLNDFEVGEGDFMFNDNHACTEILFEMSTKSRLCTFDSMERLAEECCMSPYETLPTTSSASSVAVGAISLMMVGLAGALAILC